MSGVEDAVFGWLEWVPPSEPWMFGFEGSCWINIQNIRNKSLDVECNNTEKLMKNYMNLNRWCFWHDAFIQGKWVHYHWMMSGHPLISGPPQNWVTFFLPPWGICVSSIGHWNLNISSYFSRGDPFQPSEPLVCQPVFALNETQGAKNPKLPKIFLVLIVRCRFLQVNVEYTKKYLHRNEPRLLQRLLRNLGQAEHRVGRRCQLRWSHQDHAMILWTPGINIVETRWTPLFLEVHVYNMYVI